MCHELQSKVLQRIRELEQEIESKRKAAHETALAIMEVPDSLPDFSFNRRINALEVQGIQLENEAEDLERRRDALLASPLLAEQEEVRA